MKKVILLFFVLAPAFVFAQLLNGDFENANGPDLSNWEWTCHADSFHAAPPSGGNWCIEVLGSNMQGCFPGYAYQKIPSIVNGQTYILSAWARATSVVGLLFGSINNGTITPQAEDTSSSANWTYLSVTSQFNLGPGDTAIVLLFGGISTGPFLTTGYFDLVTLVEDPSAVNDLDPENMITIFPSPMHEEAILKTDKNLVDANLNLYDMLGKKVVTIDHISGNTVHLHRNNYPAGIYLIELTENNRLIGKEKLVVY